MRYLKNKKGLELALNTVIVLIILLIVLIIVVSFFLGGTRQVFGPIVDMLTGTAKEVELGPCFEEGATKCGSSACVGSTGCVLTCSGGEWRVSKECSSGCSNGACS